MTRKAKAQSIAATSKSESPKKVWFLTGSAILVGAAIWAGQGHAESHETTTITHGWSTYGELKYPADMAHLDYVNPDAPKGGEISLWTQGTFDSMNPFATKEGTAGAYASIGYERLMQGTADEVGSAYCFLCTTLEYPEDKSWVIFHLRPEVTFSDGTPMTADDVVFSHNLLITQGTQSFADVVSQMIPSVEALDPHTVKFTFGEGFSPNDTIGQAGSSIVFQKAWYERTGARLDEARFDISPGTGPYVLDSYSVNEQIVYKRNPDYWGNDLPFNVGRNNFDTIRVEYFADTTAAFEAFKAGEFTFRQENSSLNWATGYDFPALDKGWVVKEELIDGDLPGATGFIFNLDREKFSDLRVRQAIALMYNFTWTNDTLQYGLFQQRESFWQNSDLAAKGVPEGRELELLESVKDLIDPSILTDEVTMPHTSGSDQLDRGNLRQALRLMEEAGWTPGPDGMLQKDGQPFTLELLSASPSFDRILTPYVVNLTKLGVTASYNRIDPAQFYERVQGSRDFDIYYGGYSNGLEEGEGLNQRYGSSGVGDVFNPAGYSSPAVDKLIDSIQNTETREDMAAHVRAIDRIMRRDLFVVPAWYLGKYWTAYYDMYEHPAELPPYSLGVLDFWWINADKAAELKAAGAYQ